MALSARKLAFCYEYALDFNRKRAMAAIGYTGKYPSNYVSQYLEDPEVKAKLAELRKAKQDQLNLSTFDVLDELRVIIKSDIQDFLNDDNTIVSLKSLPKEKTRAISSIKVAERYNIFGEQEITTTLSFWDKNSALEKLGKHFGVFELDNRQKQPLIQVNIGE